MPFTASQSTRKQYYENTGFTFVFIIRAPGRMMAHSSQSKLKTEVEIKCCALKAHHSHSKLKWKHQLFWFDSPCNCNIYLIRLYFYFTSFVVVLLFSYFYWILIWLSISFFIAQFFYFFVNFILCHLDFWQILCIFYVIFLWGCWATILASGVFLARYSNHSRQNTN